MTTQDIILRGESITKSYPAKTGEAPLVVLDNLSIDISRGSVVSVVGASGSGKSTLLHILGGLDRPNAGTVNWNDRDIYSMKNDELAHFRNTELGFVFQFHHLLPEFTALENVMMPALISGEKKDNAQNRAMSLLEEFGIPTRSDHRPTQLSGGEQQRVAMARALMNHPKLILADEPTGNLDESNTNILLDMLFGLREKEGVSILLITHEKNIAKRSDIIYELSKGSLHPF